MFTLLPAIFNGCANKGVRVKLILLCVAVLSLCSCKRHNKYVHSYEWRQTGASAGDMLNDTKYTDLVIEIQHFGGYAIDTATIDSIRQFLETTCRKPDGITITQAEVAPLGRTDTFTLDQAIATEKIYRTKYTDRHTLTIYVLVTNGHAAMGMIAGLAYHNTSVVLFGKTVGSDQQLFVLKHEMGHILGLVNCGSPMLVPHEDSSHVNHCNNPNCAMSFASGKTQLDSNCLNDIRAMRVEGK